MGRKTIRRGPGQRKISGKDFRLATNTLLILFAAVQTFTIGFVADLVVHRTKPPDEVDPASL